MTAAYRRTYDASQLARPECRQLLGAVLHLSDEQDEFFTESFRDGVNLSISLIVLAAVVATGHVARTCLNLYLLS